MVPMMGSSANIPTAKTIGRDEIYVAAVALRATKGPPQFLMSTAYSLNLSWDLQHFMVIIKPFLTVTDNPQALVFDLQPQDPENVFVALAALFSQKIPGIVLTRKLTRLLKNKCWMVGYSNQKTIEAIHEFNSNWETDLRIGLHDCRHYTNGLVEHLTGEKHVLESLRKRVE